MQCFIIQKNSSLPQIAVQIPSFPMTYYTPKTHKILPIKLKKFLEQMQHFTTQKITLLLYSEIEFKFSAFQRHTTL
jgi:hypothetical protein